MASSGPKGEGEESFYIDSDSSEDRLPNVHIAIKPTDDDRDLGTGGFKNARFKRDRRKVRKQTHLSFCSLMHIIGTCLCHLLSIK